MSFTEYSPQRFSRYAKDLSRAIYELRDEMGLADIRNRLGGAPSFKAHIGGGAQLTGPDGATIEVRPMASDEEIAQTLNLLKIDNATRKPMPTIAEQLIAARAQLAEARQGAANAVAESSQASQAVLGEVNKVLKEASDLRAEVAELTNGGPA